jgi:hypothetical protein
MYFDLSRPLKQASHFQSTHYKALPFYAGKYILGKKHAGRWRIFFCVNLALGVEILEKMENASISDLNTLKFCLSL